MKPYKDYMYHFPHDSFRISGRCRVRIYKRKNGTHTVLLTETRNNHGEPMTTVCDRIATNLVSRWGLNPKTTQWIQHSLPDPGSATEFEHLTFTWDENARADHPQWQSLSSEQAEIMTGEILSSLNRRLGDFDQ